MRRDIEALLQEAIQIYERALALLEAQRERDVDFDDLMRRRQRVLEDLQSCFARGLVEPGAALREQAARVNALEEDFLEGVEEAMRRTRAEMVRVRRASQGARGYEKKMRG